MTIMLVIWMSAALSTLVVGNLRAYKHQLEHWNHQQRQARVQLNRPTPTRFLLRQIIIGILHPKAVLTIVGGTIMMPPIMLLGVWLDPEMFDFAHFALTEEDLAMRQEFKKRYNMEWRIVSDQDSQEHQLWQTQYLEERYGIADICEHIGIALSKMASFVTLLFGLLLAPFGIFVPKASAQTRSDSNITRIVDPETTPFDPGITDVHGAISAGLFLSVPTEDDDSMQWRLRQLDLKVLPRISPEVSATIVLGLAKFVDGPTDPVLVASIDWKPSSAFELTGGRILNPVGLSRQLPPHKLIELTYATTGITAPFIEHGLVATWRPTSWLELDMGLLSGHGTSSEPDAKPDGVLLARFKPADELTLGLDFQTGEQDAGWHHVLGLHARYDVGVFFGQAEAVANFDAGDDRPTIGWYALCAPTRSGSPTCASNSSTTYVRIHLQASRQARSASTTARHKTRLCARPSRSHSRETQRLACSSQPKSRSDNTPDLQYGRDFTREHHNRGALKERSK